MNIDYNYDELFQEILDTLPARGFDPDLLILVPQLDSGD